MVDDDPYEVLGVSPQAPTWVIAAAFKAHARRAHPDAGGEPVQFRRAQEAWEILQDPDRREAVDRRRADQAARAGTDSDAGNEARWPPAPEPGGGAQTQADGDSEPAEQPVAPAGTRWAWRPVAAASVAMTVLRVVGFLGWCLIGYGIGVVAPLTNPDWPYVWWPGAWFLITGIACVQTVLRRIPGVTFLLLIGLLVVAWGPAPWWWCVVTIGWLFTVAVISTGRAEKLAHSR